MTAEGYDYKYALTMISYDPGGYGTYSSTATTSHMEVTVDPAPWRCASCRHPGHALHVGTCASCHKIKGSPDV